MTVDGFLTPELAELRESVQRFCARYAQQEQVRAAMESDLGYDRGTWRKLGSDLGILGLMVAAEYGGQGGGLAAQAVAVEELGAALMPGPVVGTVAMGIPLLTALAPGGLAKELLPGIVAGELTTAFAMPAMGRLPGAAGSTVTARRTGSGWALDGEVPAVTDGVDASVLLLPASTQDGTCLFAVLSDAPGLHREPRQTMDLTRRQARLRLAGTPGELAASSAESSDACAKVFAVASVLIAAEQIGGARHMLEETCKHVSQRIQFGMPIGTFQAVKHRCADMFISLEQARSLTYHAIGRLHEEPGGAQLTVHMARAVASECFYRTAASAIQLHGGLGFTWEHQAHLYFKRAVADAVLLGTADEHYEAIADQVLPD